MVAQFSTGILAHFSISIYILKVNIKILKINENRKHIALILKKIHFNPANTKAHCPSFGLRLPNGPLNFPLLSFTPCRLSTLNTELRLLYPLTAMMSSKE